MTTKPNHRDKLYGKERMVLERIERVLKRESEDPDSNLLEEYRILSRKYDSLLKDSIKLTKVSDSTHRKLMNAKEVIARKTKELAEKNETLYRISVTDHLTGVYNRTYLMDAFSRELAKSRRHDMAMACVIMDIDHFKTFNDTHGHLTGDYVLKETARLIRELVREHDIFGRYGGEEFLLILTGTTQSQAGVLAEKIRTSVAGARYRNEGRDLRVTLSLGISDLDDCTDVDDMIRRADEALYRAKNLGRNRVEFYSESPA